jgi:DNA-binding response OmpR family regulator
MDILLGDDVAQTRTAIRRRFAQRGIFVVVAKRSDVVAQLGDRRFAALILEWSPRLTIVRAVRVAGWTIPILLYTQLSCSQKQRAIALDAGADDFMCDPIDGFVELVARTRALARRANGAFTRHRVGRIAFDSGARDVFVDEQSVRLTKNEFTLLESLLLRSPHGVSKHQLFIDLRYGGDAGAAERLKQLVMRLRRKLGAAGEQIQVVERFGYCLVENRIPVLNARIRRRRQTQSATAASR